MKQKKITKWLSVLLCLVLTATLFAACGKGTDEETNTNTPATEDSATPVSTDLNPLTGEALQNKDAIGKRPVAIMVENSPAARPQWGLSSPDIVVEGVAEAGITRMMWLYADVYSAPKVGPTRSARHDYLEVAEGLDAIFVHFGGSPYAYEALQRDKVQDIDGVKADGKYFKRDSSRKVSKEHTAYTKGEWLADAITSKNIRQDIKADYAAPFKFAAQKRTLPGGACKSIGVVFSNDYPHTFTYNENDGLYYNHMKQAEMKDANGKTMTVSNVLVLYTPVSLVPGSDKGHVDWDLSGGVGVYASNGTYQNIKWSKGNPSAPLKLTDENGNALELNPGKSWIGFVPSAQKGATTIA